MALSATFHCLLGCSIGEIIGQMIGTALGWDNFLTTIVATVLAFTSGYLLSTWPLVRHGLPFTRAARLVLAADTLSILTMEIMDNLVMLIIPGAMDTHLGDWLFWGSMVLSLLAAFVVAYPVNLWLLKRGKGHALTHHHMHHH